ncbi:acyl-CoA thioesterase-1 [Caulobacter ginsengisoli]|uniref:Acyl-CoA thioesterase-1 n=1 Tax=Caulobacter ginsengisoli TaxID=400775 RepID=A0ABU0IXX8_9CAUL|nr:arylesterase [Caulobacter ginsengisoli]MDQ0466186.1 acyl-CoA thioesterase-1 [Caulobacter ginsengisoli]
MTCTPHPTRRVLIAALALAPATPVFAAGKPRIVTILGDSITAGYGLPAAQSLPVQLEAALKARGLNVKVRGAGVSGDTTQSGLARVDFSVQSDTALCLIALGGNDLLQGLDTGRTKANLASILKRLKARRIHAMLAGMRAPTAIGAGYARDFSAIYPALAKQYGVPLYPDLLAGVAGIPRLNQRDGIHPNPAGVKLIVQKLAPAIARVLT